MRKLYLILLIFICSIMLGSCSSTSTLEQSIPVDDTSIVSMEDSLVIKSIIESIPDPFYDLATKQEDKWGFKGIYAYELLERMENEDFFFYLYDSTMPIPIEEEMIIWGFKEGNLDILANGYLIDFSSLNVAEQEKIREFFPKNTIYAIENGEIKSTLCDYSLLPIELTEDNNLDYKQTIESWFYSTMVGLNDHGFTMITYEELLTKIEQEENFLLYVGRDSCKYCEIFIPVLEHFVDKYSITYMDTQEEIPLYYLNTQSYYNDIVNGVPNAEETWQNIKDTLHIEYTPGFLLYRDNLVCVFDENGNLVRGGVHKYGGLHFTRYINKTYFANSPEVRAEQFQTCLSELHNSLNYEVTLTLKDDCYSEYTHIDNKEYSTYEIKGVDNDCFIVEDRWLEYVANKEYIPEVNEEFLEDLDNNMLKSYVAFYMLEKPYDKTIDLTLYSSEFRGTGFIIDIEEDCLYLACSQHGINPDIKNRNGFEVVFSRPLGDPEAKVNDRYTLNYSYEYDAYDGYAQIVGYTKANDFAILRVNFKESDMDYERRFSIQPVPRFDNYTIQTGDIIRHWDCIKLRDSNNYSDPIFHTYEVLTLLDTSYWGFKGTFVSGGVRNGTSGSPMYNNKGEIVGIVIGSSDELNQVCLLPSSTILQEFENIVGRPLYND